MSEVNNEEKVLKISKHAKERYAERIMNKDDETEIQRYILLNEDKIINDINKMVQYATLIFSGKQQKDKKFVNVYSKDCWIILVDPSNDTVITLYKVNLGCGADLDYEYVKRMKQLLNKAQDDLEQAKMAVINETNMYREKITENNDMISRYKSYIKNLESLNEGYQEIIENNNIKVETESQNVIDIINKLIKTKVF